MIELCKLMRLAAKRWYLLLLGAAWVFNAQADEIIVAKVSLVEPTYMPGRVTFMLEGGSPSCPAGTWLGWVKDADSNKAVYAGLIAAMATGKRVTLYIGDGDTSCTGKFLHVLAN